MKSIRFGLIVIAVSGLVVLAAGIRVAVWIQAAEAIASQMQAISNQLRLLELASDALVDLEGGQRGYLLTGDPASLGSYDKARRDLTAALTALDAAFGGDAAHRQDIAEIAKLARAAEDEAARTVRLHIEGQQAAAIEAAAADRGRGLREAARSRLRSVVDRLRRALADLDGLQKEKFRYTYRLSALVVLAVDLLVIVAIVSLSISIQRMREQQREQQREQVHQAMHDPLTGLPNRRYLGEWLNMALAAAQRSGRPLVLLYFDLDGFKSINDRFGHEAGDRVLQVTAARLRGALRMADFFARLGGDEFIAVLPEAPTGPNLSMLVERLQGAIAKAPIPEVRDGTVCASIGAAWFPADGDTVDTLLAAADQAMYVVKQRRQASPSEQARARSAAT